MKLGGLLPESSPNPLYVAYQQAEYRDALSKAFDALLNPGDNAIEVYSRVFYALLADGLVLLIGFSLTRKKTSLYRIRNWRDLTKDAPELIGEALYSLAAEAGNDTSYEAYTVALLLHRLKSFMSCFEFEPYMDGAGLNANFSLVCKDLEKKKILETQFMNFTSLLRALRYLKPLSLTQYTFFTEYRRNKAVQNSPHSGIITPTGDDDYVLLMTEGCQLYLAEKINDLYQHIDADTLSSEIQSFFTTPSDSAETDVSPKRPDTETEETK
jgi:hypothetical protein